MFLKLLAKVFNWRLVTLYGKDGKSYLRKREELVGRAFAWRYNGHGFVELFENGRVGGTHDIVRWESAN